VYILNREFRAKKQLVTQLRNVTGINNFTAKDICARVLLHKETKTRNIKQNRISFLNKYITENLIIGPEVVSIMRTNIKNKIQVRGYQGMRYSYGLPVRGQRSKTNAQTAKKLHRNKSNK
jgi:small subunit ribosomal protein S13